MRIFVADALPEACMASLSRAGHEVTLEPLKGQALQCAVAEAGAEVLIVRSTRVDRQLLQACSGLELIVRAGAGYDTIDYEFAAERGVFVANCPGKNASAVAELAVGLMLGLDRRIADNVRDARAGTWNKARYAKARGLRGRTLAIIGFGNIGRAVAERAKGLEMNLVVWSRSLTALRAEALGMTYAASPEAAASVADIVTIHVASNADTYHLAGPAFFEAMKPGACLINTSRGSVVDENALVHAMDTKGIRAGLDVFEGEPAYKSGPLEAAIAGHPNVYLTHHIGASTAQAQEATATEAVRIIEAYAREGRVPNCVNLAVQSAASHLLTVRHLDRVGVLASVLDKVRQANGNVQEMENLVFAGDNGAACARIWLAGAAPAVLLRRVRTVEHVLTASVTTL